MPANLPFHSELNQNIDGFVNQFAPGLSTIEVASEMNVSQSMQVPN
jgi:hypothetical protein